MHVVRAPLWCIAAYVADWLMSWFELLHDFIPQNYIGSGTKKQPMMPPNKKLNLQSCTARMANDKDDNETGDRTGGENCELYETRDLLQDKPYLRADINVNYRRRAQSLPNSPKRIRKTPPARAEHTGKIVTQNYHWLTVDHSSAISFSSSVKGVKQHTANRQYMQLRSSYKFNTGIHYSRSIHWRWNWGQWVWRTISQGATQSKR